MTDAAPPPKMIALIKGGVRDATYAWDIMPGVISATLLAFVALRSAIASYRRSVPEFGFDAAVIEMIGVVAGATLLAPIGILVARLFILGERGSFGALARLGPILLRTVAASVALSVLVFAPLSVFTWTAPPSEEEAPLLTGVILPLGAFAVGLVLCVVTMRFWPLFPAIAVVGEGRTPRSAWRLGRGSTWRAFAIVALLYLPPFLVIYLPMAVTEADSAYDLYATPALEGAVEAALAVIGAAVFARLYRWRLDRQT